jgi:hypothetical protein
VAALPPSAAASRKQVELSASEPHSGQQLCGHAGEVGMQRRKAAAQNITEAERRTLPSLILLMSDRVRARAEHGAGCAPRRRAPCGPGGRDGRQAPPRPAAAAVPQAQRAVAAGRGQQRAGAGRLRAHAEDVARLPALGHRACPAPKTPVT